MKTQILATLENARQYTLAVADGMPAEHYHFKPANEVWDFNELMHHIGYGIYWWEENLIRQQESEWNPPKVTTSKKQTIAYLEKAFDFLKQQLEGLSGDKVAVQGFHATIDHITHHRGQATIHLRCKGIVPPEYRY